MGFINTVFNKNDMEKRDNEINSSPNMATLGGTSVNGEIADIVVDEENILKIPTASACLNLICGTIAQLPIYLYKENNDGNVEKIKDDTRLFLLNNEANNSLTAFDFKKHMVKDYLIHGGSYNYIEKVGNEIIALYPLPAKGVRVEKYFESVYKFTAEINSTVDGKSEKFEPLDILSVCRDTEDGLKGKGLKKQGEDVFKLALNEVLYSNNVLSKGVLPIGYLKTEGRLKPDTITRLRESIKSIFSGAKNAGQIMILEEGMDYKTLSLSPSDLNLNDSKKNSAEEICKLFNVPASLVLNNGGYGNVEQDNLHFLKYCLQEIITSIEDVLNKMMLLEDEKNDGYYFRFDTTEIARSTEKEKYEAIEKGMKAGVMSINEARAKLDLEPIDDDYMMFSLGNIFYNKGNKKFIVPNTGQVINENEVGNNVNSGNDNPDDFDNI